MEWVSKIDQGKVRETQEDAIGFWPEESPRLFVVADGLGGHPDGEVASQTAVSVMIRQAGEKKGFKTYTRQRKALEKANRELWLLNKEKIVSERMATTLTSLYFQDHELFIAHVGDTRIYRYRKTSLGQLTTDHALGPHTLTQALGLERKLTIEVKRLKVKKDDLYIVCSDGFHGMIENAVLTDILGRENNIQNAAAALLEEALQKGEDNISFFLIRV